MAAVKKVRLPLRTREQRAVHLAAYVRRLRSHADPVNGFSMAQGQCSAAAAGRSAFAQLAHLARVAQAEKRSAVDQIGSANSAREHRREDSQLLAW